MRRLMRVLSDAIVVSAKTRAPGEGPSASVRISAPKRRWA